MKIEDIVKKYLEYDEDEGIEYPDKRDIDLLRLKVKGGGLLRGSGDTAP